MKLKWGKIVQYVPVIFDRKIHLAGPSNGNILFFVHTQSNYVNLLNLGTFQDSINKYVLLSNQKNLKFPKKSHRIPKIAQIAKIFQISMISKNAQKIQITIKSRRYHHIKKISNFQKNRQNSQNRQNCQTSPNFYLCNTYF